MTDGTRPPRVRPVPAALLVASGVGAVTCLVVLHRSLLLIVGSTSYAISALLVALMIGMSAGSALGGRLADRNAHPLRLFAAAQGAMGAYSLAFPAILPALQALYLDLAPPMEGPAGPRHLVRFLLGIVALGVPSFLTGIAIPACTKALAAGRTDMGHRAARVCALYALGASAGALLTARVLVPRLGLVGSIACGAVLSAGASLLAWRLSQPLTVEARSAAPAPDRAIPAGRRGVLLLVALASGLLSFALAMTWTHLLAILVGDTVDALGLMTGGLLLGLALGARLAEAFAEPEARASAAIGTSQMLAGLVVLATLGAWDRVFLMDATRFVVASILMLLPTAFIGMTLPLLVRCAGASPARFGRNAGLVCAAHTLGAAAGALLGAYRLLPALGSLGSLRLLAALVLLVGAAAVVALSSHRGRWLAVGAGLVGAALGAWRPVAWDLEAWNGAAAIHLGHSTRGQGQRLYRREDPTGGLTTVVESRGVKTLLANGTFQGDDGEEVPVQHRLAHVPTLLTSGRERVLVIGLGTGVTLASIAAHGFEHAVCAEPSGPIVEAARAHFAGTNGGVLDRPSVELVRDDGPSVLLERGDLYDVVSVEARSIGLAGAGAVKSDDFYRLVSRRLKRHGVLLQRFPMRPLSARSLFTVVSAVRSVFPHVSVWNHRRQGFVVASNEPLAVDVASVRADLAREGLRPYLRELASGSPLEVLGDLVVAEVDEDRFLDGMAEPTGTFLDFQDRATLRRVRSPRPLPFRGEPLAAERSLVEAAFVHGWSDPRALAQLALTWAADASESRVASRYLLDELTGDEVEGGGPDEDPVAGLRQASPALSAMIAAAAPAAECRPAPAFVTDPRAPHRTLLDSRGLTLAPTQPEEAIDDRATPDWGEGWRVRPEGAPPWIEMAFDRPLLLDTVHVVVRPIDGSVVRARLYGRGAGGRWRPLASGGQVEDMACRDMRVYHLAPAPEPLVALGVEFQGEALSDRIAVHEVWAVERR